MEGQLCQDLRDLGIPSLVVHSVGLWVAKALVRDQWAQHARYLDLLAQRLDRLHLDRKDLSVLAEFHRLFQIDKQLMRRDQPRQVLLGRVVLHQLTCRPLPVRYQVHNVHQGWRRVETCLRVLLARPAASSQLHLTRTDTQCQIGECLFLAARTECLPLLGLTVNPHRVVICLPLQAPVVCHIRVDIMLVGFHRQDRELRHQAVGQELGACRLQVGGHPRLGQLEIHHRQVFGGLQLELVLVLVELKVRLGLGGRCLLVLIENHLPLVPVVGQWPLALAEDHRRAQVVVLLQLVLFEGRLRQVQAEELHR